MPYASKELIERAVAYLNHPQGVPLVESIFEIVSDLAKAAPLPTDAEHEAAIERWREVAMAVTAQAYHVGDSSSFILRGDEINEICNLARRAPRPEPTLPEPEIEAHLVDQIADSAIAHRAFQHQSIQGILALTEQDEIEDCHLDGDYTQLGSVTKVIMRGLRLTIDGDTLTVTSLVAEPKPEPRASNDSVRYTCHKCMFEVDTDKPYSVSWVRPNDGAEASPRPSSALLAAASKVAERWRSSEIMPSDDEAFAESIFELIDAISAEESRGAIEDIGKIIDDNSDAMHMLAKDDEIEQLSQSERRSLVDLRARLDEVVKELSDVKNDRDKLRAMADPAVCRTAKIKQAVLAGDKDAVRAAVRSHVERANHSCGFSVVLFGASRGSSAGHTCTGCRARGDCATVAPMATHPTPPRTTNDWWLGEREIRVTSIPDHVPPTSSGKRVSINSAFRWTTAGYRGVRIRRYRCGGSWCTTLEELARWQAALTAAHEAVA